jgi:hypothetical protein
LNREVDPDGRTELRIDLGMLGKVVNPNAGAAKALDSDHVEVAVDRDRGIAFLEIRLAFSWKQKNVSFGLPRTGLLHEVHGKRALLN